VAIGWSGCPADVSTGSLAEQANRQDVYEVGGRMSASRKKEKLFSIQLGNLRLC
jgi:hypothetical protein